MLYIYILIITVSLLIFFNKITIENYVDLWDSKKVEEDIKNKTSGLFDGIKSFLESAVKVFEPKIPGKKPCPDGMRDDGTSCWRDTYGRGAGNPAPLNSCPSGSNDIAGTCWYPGSGGDCTGGGCRTWWDGCKSRAPGWLGGGCIGGANTVCEPIRCNPIVPARVARNIGDRGYSCPANEELWGIRCYPKCRPGYRSVGCCLCEPDGGPGIKVTAFERYQCPPPGQPQFGKLVGALCYKSDTPASPPPTAQPKLAPPPLPPPRPGRPPRPVWLPAWMPW